MSSYIKRLNAGVAAMLARQAEQERAEAEAASRVARERLTPLEQRLARLLATIPLSIQREGVSLTSLQASLRGRSGGNAHAGELGAALRKLGFERRRQWHGAAGFQALWCKLG